MTWPLYKHCYATIISKPVNALSINKIFLFLFLKDECHEIGVALYHICCWFYCTVYIYFLFLIFQPLSHAISPHNHPAIIQPCIIQPSSCHHPASILPASSHLPAIIQPSSSHHPAIIQPSSCHHPASIQPSSCHHPAIILPSSCHHPAIILPSSCHHQAIIQTRVSQFRF